MNKINKKMEFIFVPLALHFAFTLVCGVRNRWVFFGLEMIPIMKVLVTENNALQQEEKKTIIIVLSPFRTYTFGQMNCM